MFEELSMDIEKFKNLIIDGYCPWCGKGPFKVIGAHTSLKHGINSEYIKETCGFNRSKGLALEDYKEKQREIAINRGLGIKEELKGCQGKVIHSGIKLRHEGIENIKNDRNKPYRKNISFKTLSKNRDKINKKKQDKVKNDKSYVEKITNIVLNANKNFKEKNLNEWINIKKKNSKKQKAKMYGTEEGFPDVVWVKTALNFIETLKEGSRRNIYIRMSEKYNLPQPVICQRVRKSIKNGFIKWTGKKCLPDGVLTEKTLKFITENPELFH